MAKFTTTQRYSAGAILLSIVFLIAISWLILAALKPDKPVNVTEIEMPPVEQPEPVIDHVARHEGEVRQLATELGLEGRVVVAIMRTETLVKAPKEFEGQCSIKEDHATCVPLYADKYKKMETFLGRKPTPGEMLLAHTIDTGPALKITHSPGHFLTKDLDKELIEQNGVFLRRETVEDLRIWLGKTVYRAMR